jgi:outer membrane protein assembly factor BamB
MPPGDRVEMNRRYFIFIALVAITGACDHSGQHGIPSASKVSAPVSGLLESWPREGPELLWKYQGLGRGYGGPYISGDEIFINGEEDGNSYTLCLDHHGTLRWKSPNGKEFLGIDYAASFPGTRSAPAVAGSQVYAISGTGHLSCFDKQTGKVIWAVDLVKDFDGIPGDFGYSESPVVDEEKVYCFAGGKVHNMVALDRYTGDLVWSSPVKQDYFSYGTPILLSLSDRSVLVGTSRNYIFVVDRRDGKLLSSYRLEDIKVGYEHCNSVVHRDGYIYFVASEEQGQGTIKLLLSEDGSTLEEVWRNNTVLNIFGGFIVNEPCLYTTLENKKLVCLDTETGRIGESVRAESGSIVYADHKLFIYGHNGKVQLFSLKEGKPQLKSEMRILDGSGHHFSFPVIANGVMYIRRGDALMAYALR